jgi:hypothetical protein
VSATTVQLLRAASEIVGGNALLAGRLGVSEVLLARFMADSYELPDPLLLRAVDIILAERESGFSRLPQADETAQNCGRGSGATTRAGSA